MARYRSVLLQGITLFLSSFIIVMGTCSADEYCVQSEETETYADNCKSLMYYVNHSEVYFTTDDTTFIFLTGHHELLSSAFIANVSNLIFTGDTSNSSTMNRATVMCSNSIPGGLSFFNITNLTIESLRFIECSALSHSYNHHVALEMRLIHNLHICSVEIFNTTGYGLIADSLFDISYITDITIDSCHNTSRTEGGNFQLYCSDYYNDYVKSLSHSLLVEDSQFLNGENTYNQASRASGVYIQIECHVNLTVIFNRVEIANNVGRHGGNIAIQYSSFSSRWTVVISVLNSNISSGYAYEGGGLYITASLSKRNQPQVELNSSCIIANMPILSINNTNFLNSTAQFVGAALYLRLYEKDWSTVGRISFYNCTFKSNELRLPATDLVGHGGATVHILIYPLPQYKQHVTPLFQIQFTDCNIFRSAIQPSSILTSRIGAFYIQSAHSVSLENCHFGNNECTGIIAIHSRLLLHGWNIIENNNGTSGGGLLFCGGTMMHLYSGTELNITGNYATEYGGGIYVENDCSEIVPFCFFQIDDITVNTSTLNKTKVNLFNNTATVAGSALYGGIIDQCLLFEGTSTQSSHPKSTSQVFNDTFHLHNNDSHHFSIISSNPMTVCFCSNCNFAGSNTCLNGLSVNATPGSTFHVSAILLGQRNGLVPGVVVTSCLNNCSIAVEQKTQYLDTNGTQCSILNYTVFSEENTTKTLQLVVEDNYYQYTGYFYRPPNITVLVQKCPAGFTITRDDTCNCILENKYISCILKQQIIKRQPPTWIGFKEHPAKNTNYNTNYIIFHEFCPLGYCLNKNVTINTTIKTFNQDAQCAQNRKGLLCGACKTNHSLGFGTSVCLRCKHKPLPGLRVVGLIAVCGVAGILLVVLLTLLNLTVSEGTLNGLIFYANIVQVNSDIFFPPESHARPLAAFIAWLNLDFGITACFYDGMDAYAKTWLQFLFPLYIWLISGAIVYFSWKSNRVARLAGRNAVKVLATLFLLSFGKLLRTIIAAVSYTNVVSHDQTIDISVWLPDASVHYLHTKHITLYVTALLAGVLTILYTLTLTFIQCLRKAPENRMFVWVRKLKPLLDAYTGPYKNRYHFWTGLLLLVRILLFVAFAFNLTIGPVLNLSVIILVSTLLMIAIQPGIYRHVFLGLLESSMYVNLILFSTVMIFLIDSYTEYKILAAYFFGGWALVTFLGIVAYHAYRRMFGAPDCGQLRVWCREKLRPRGVAGIHPVIIPRDDSEELESEESEEEREMNATWNTPHLRESLIGSIQR